MYDTMYMPFVIQREERYLVHISYHATSILYTIYKHNSYGFKEFCTSFISPQKSPGSIQWFHATAAGTMKALVTIAAIHELQGKSLFSDFCWWISDLKAITSKTNVVALKGSHFIPSWPRSLLVSSQLIW